MTKKQTMTAPLGACKRIALVAHDHMKGSMMEWAMEHKEQLARHKLCGTGTTARLAAQATGLEITAYQSGPLGGDMQLGGGIAQGEIDMLIFFWDPLSPQPHDPDVKALLRVAALYNIPVATNRSTADFLITSPYLDREYPRQAIDFGASATRWWWKFEPSNSLVSEGSHL